MKFAAGTLFLAMAACGVRSATPAGPPDACKPSPPVDVEVRTVGRADPGTPFGLVVTASSRVAGPVEVRVDLPAGTLCCAGSTYWIGKLTAGGCKELCLDVVVPDRDRREILVCVTCTPDEGTRYARCASVVLNDAPINPQGIPGRNAAGEGILDFRQP